MKYSFEYASFNVLIPFLLNEIPKLNPITTIKPGIAILSHNAEPN